MVRMATENFASNLHAGGDFFRGKTPQHVGTGERDYLIMYRLLEFCPSIDRRFMLEFFRQMERGKIQSMDIESPSVRVVNFVHQELC